MKQHIETEKPRKSRKRSAAFFLLLAQGSLTLSQAACAPRIATSATPVGAPMVTFISPPVDTAAVRGEILNFAISVSSLHELVSVHADVMGAINYQFPAANPADTVFNTVFRVPTSGAVADSITLTVTAVDINGTRGTGKRSIILR